MSILLVICPVAVAVAVNLLRSGRLDDVVVNQADVDAEQTDEILINKKVILDLIARVEDLGGGDVTPTEWEDIDEPIPYTDRAVFPPYVVADHLVSYQDGLWLCSCHPRPPAPFNPFWGIEGHEFEAVGAHKYVAATHDQWIEAYGEITKAERLERIAHIVSLIPSEAP